MRGCEASVCKGRWQVGACVMASQGELVARMEWLLEEVDKKNAEMQRKQAEHHRVMQEKAHMQATSGGGAEGGSASSARLAQQVAEAQHELETRRSAKEAKTRQLAALKAQARDVEARMEVQTTRALDAEDRVDEIQGATKALLKKVKRLEKEIQLTGARIKSMEDKVADKERHVALERQRSDMNVRTVADLEQQVGQLQQKRQLMENLRQELESNSEMILDRDEEIERAEAAVAQLRKEQDAARVELSSANAEVGSLRDELQRKHAGIVAAVGETERMARDNVGLLREKQRIDHEQSEMRREFEHIQHVHTQATRVRDEATGALAEYENKVKAQEEERELVEKELRGLDEALRALRTQAERHNSKLRDAEAASRQRTQGLEHVIEAKQALWQRMEQDRQRLKESAKQAKQREIAALFQSLRQEEKQAFADLEEEGRARGSQNAGPVEIGW